MVLDICKSLFTLVMAKEMFKIGDLITLVYNSAQMLVTGYNSNGQVNCALWVEGHLVNFMLPESSIRKVPDPAPQLIN